MRLSIVIIINAILALQTYGHPFNKRIDEDEVFELNQSDRGTTKDGLESYSLIQSQNYPYVNDLPSSIIKPKARDAQTTDEFNVIDNFGALKPYKSSLSIGLENVSPKPPQSCSIDKLYMLHRHGARYPTKSAAPTKFNQTFTNETQKDVQFNGELEFLNNWTYKLGIAELVTLGRQELFDSGIRFRMNYGTLLQKYSKNHKLEFRTTTQERMYKSAINFLLGFLGDDWESKANLLQIHEKGGYNNTLHPSSNCDKKGKDLSKNFNNIYLKDPLNRLNSQVDGWNLTIDDVEGMIDMCAYETIALGYSEFCKLFTKHEFESYNYAWDLKHYYKHGFGSSSISKAQGKGWVLELLSRLQNKLPNVIDNDSSINSTLDENDDTFSLDQPFYIDFSHDSTIDNVIVTLNLTQYQVQLPTDHILDQSPRWVTSNLAPLAANLLVQVLNCSDDNEKYARVILNDAVISLENLGSCGKNEDGRCNLNTFINGLEDSLKSTDFDSVCS